jgi:putative oxidoreductase
MLILLLCNGGMMLKFLSKYEDVALLLARIGIGLSFVILHGWGKITGGPQRWKSVGTAMKNLGLDFLPVFWGFMAAFSETIGGVLVILGLFFRPAAALVLITMFVAAVKHISAGDPLSKIAHPVELGLVMILFLVIGAGKYSLDYIVWRKS